jgi:hypothetical protein
MAITPKDHERLHDWIARAALAGASATVLELMLARAGFGMSGVVAALARVALIGAIVVPPQRFVEGAALVLVGLWAGAAARAPMPVGIVIGALALGVAVARGLGGSLRRRMAALGVASAAAMCAMVIQGALLETGALTSLFGPGLGAMAGGAIAGAVMGLGAIGRLLYGAAQAPAIQLELDQLAADVEKANAEVGGLLRRASSAYRQAIEVVSDLPGSEAPAAKKAADDLVRRMVRFGVEWREVERRATETTPEQLTERVAVLETRLEKTEDTVAKAELTRAIAAVKSQAAALKEILHGRERAVARLEHQVATLERLRLAALRHRSADASRIQAELQPVVEELAEAGGDYDLASDALRDADEEGVTIDLPRPRAN